MWLVAGLGNPEKKYETTRHNVGWLVADKLADQWSLDKKREAEVDTKKIGQQKVLLAKPQTYMNNSGRSVQKLISYYKVDAEQCIIIHDDIDLPFGKIKISKNISSAGHKGVQSVINSLKTKDFIRIRIGITPKRAATVSADVFVLKNFTVQEKKDLSKIIKTAATAVNDIIEQGFEQAMNEHNKK